MYTTIRDIPRGLLPIGSPIREIPRELPVASPGQTTFAVIQSWLIGTGSAYAMERALQWMEYVQPRVVGFIVLDSANLGSEASERVDARTAVEHLENIRSVFDPAVSDLANLFDVSRQAIYKWLAGDSTPEPDKAARITAVSQIADAVKEAGISRAGALLKMKAFGGQSLLDLLKAGEDCTAQVRTLIAEAQSMEVAYERSGLAQSKAKPTNDWQSSISIPSSPEAG